MVVNREFLKGLVFRVLGNKQIKLFPQSGGCINECFKIEAGHQKYFCKVNSVSKLPQLFEAEVNGLQLLKSTNIFKTPEIVHLLYEEDYQVLILEWIESGIKTATFWKRFGSSLAKLHEVSNNEFGWDIHNYMGSVPQLNDQQTNWSTFFVEQRLKPLIQKCKAKNLITSFHESIFQNLFNKIPEIFKDARPSLVHGDLWSGNFMCDIYEEPVLIDPAVYYGLPAVDLGMTNLFGGFSPLFYEAYQKQKKFSTNQHHQNNISNLYPLLIHLFLFGKTYLSQIEETIKEFK